MTTELKQAVAFESGHWYDAKTGEPRYTIIGKNGKERNTTLRDAREHGYVPSVTTITKVMAAPGLENWKQDQVLESAATLPMVGMTEDEWRKAVKAEAKLKAAAAAERGTKLHAAIEADLTSALLTPPEYEEHINKIYDHLLAVGVDLEFGESERSFASPLGYGGKCDWHSRNQQAIVDFKTKDVIEDGKKLAYDQNIQLAAYREGLQLPPDTRCFNVFIGVTDGKVVVHEWSQPEIEKGWRMFKLCLAMWQEVNNWNPDGELSVEQKLDKAEL